MKIRTAIFIASDLMLSELQKGTAVADVKVGDKVSIKQNVDSVSLMVGGTEVVTSGEIKDSFLAHHRARRQLSPLARDVFEKVVKGGDFGESYIYDIPAVLKYNFPELNEHVRESYVCLIQSLAWMLRTGSLVWTV